jgi:tetratricopeptide (TPR) repeat protein
MTTAELLRGTLRGAARAERPGEHLNPTPPEPAAALHGLRWLDDLRRRSARRSTARSVQHLEQFDDAARHFTKALEVAGEGHTLASVLHFDLAACALGLRVVPDLEPQSDRKGSDAALKHLDQATVDPKNASFNAYFTRGILRFERGMHAEAAQDFRDALDRIEQYRNPLPVTLARIRFYLALSMLRGGAGEGQEEAVRHLEQAMDRLSGRRAAEGAAASARGEGAARGRARSRASTSRT